MEAHYTRSPAVKRLMKEAQELSEATAEYFAQPLTDNLFEWHFTIRGPADTEFDGGVYHGRIILPPDYPMKPPNIIILTPNGRFETGKKICLSISGHHPESWQPSWSIRTALLAIIGFMPTPGHHTLGSLDYPVEERRQLAKKSRQFCCKDCCDQPVEKLLKSQTAESASVSSAEAKDIIESMSIKGEDDSQPESAALEASVSEETEKERDRRMIKEASIRVQQKFRERIQGRAQGLEFRLQGQALKATGNSANTASSSVAAAAASGSEPRWYSHISIYDLLMAIVALTIAVLLYKRYSGGVSPL